MQLGTLQRSNMIQVKTSDVKPLEDPSAGFAGKEHIYQDFYLRKAELSMIATYKSIESRQGYPDEFFSRLTIAKKLSHDNQFINGQTSKFQEHTISKKD